MLYSIVIKHSCSGYAIQNHFQEDFKPSYSIVI